MSAPSPARPPLSDADERLYASLAHFGNIVGFLPSLLVLVILGGRGAFVRSESREALNFSLTALIAWVGLAILGQILDLVGRALPVAVALVPDLLGFLVGLAQLAVWVVVVVLSIIAGLRVQHGGGYRYPIALRLVR
ncbi:DUF4870 domain-containing protein [Amnibacterium endophyticum]|uniref:DUF4870 domain-containing protein n=1 Tax=Amnibacterium endophyticum TaxID=2109337 RepID=A0ABW4LF80_9MICO